MAPDLAPDLLEALASLPDDRYAVRSSAVAEDLAGASFAGQYTTVLDVARDDLPGAVRTCLASAASAGVSAYLDHHANLGRDAHPDLGAPGMAVVVQRMVRADHAGVAFTLDPLTGADTELVVEYVEGLGDALVAGQVVPRTRRYDWYHERWDDEAPSDGPAPAQWDDLAAACVAAQQLYGFPLDLEFALADGKVWLLQARPVTRVTHTRLTDMWSTADFKDGGVSATTCTAYMWSLYDYVWERSLRDFLVTSRLVSPQRLRQLGQMHYGRPYWNLSVVKEVMSRVPGYRERDFDEEFGITGSYDGDGTVTALNARTAAWLVPVAWVQRRLLAQREHQADALAADLRATVAARLAELDDLAEAPLPDLQAAFARLTREDYLTSETTYFWQIFLNTVHQALFRDWMARHVDRDGYLELISGLEDISHLRPVTSVWSLSRQLRATGCVDEAAFGEHLERFGYHSDKELDVSYPNYAELPEAVRRQVGDLARLDDDANPRLPVERQHTAYQARLDHLRARRGPLGRRRLTRRVTRMRTLLWWREEFRDLSTQLYDVIRRYTLVLAGRYAADGVLDAAEDVWHLAVDDLWAYGDGRRTADDLRSQVTRNRRYFDAYRHYHSDNEIGPLPPARPDASADGSLRGVGCSAGRVAGPARVVADLDDVGRLRPGDVLVTRFTDTGWTASFALAAAVVTEYGGTLCHAAIVSREYGIPCVVHATGATSWLHDGQHVTVDGAAGTVEVFS